ncbi:hypothetical protein CV102_02870 [Natronococcus pandeyae]|uniref:Uncharacterized protein n=1 Tax=Natronococcus pandeyae TaxID=2055836 RepID=A0A8J8Q7W3_9EURY|nr:hypothetical protein [Natronococcus pandeyae]TYL40527.1 hypothetical protein CV102_02870 [Natronococcus pandeyae]
MFTDDEIGKHVETASGETIGVVVSVDGATAYVDRDPSAMDAINALFGRETDEEGTVPIDEEDVETVTDDAIRLEKNRSSRDEDAEGGTDPVFERNEETVDEDVNAESRRIGSDAGDAAETADEEGRSGEAMEPSTEEMDESGAERHDETEDMPPEGERTVTDERGENEDR